MAPPVNPWDAERAAHVVVKAVKDGKPMEGPEIRETLSFLVALVLEQALMEPGTVEDETAQTAFDALLWMNNHPGYASRNERLIGTGLSCKLADGVPK